MLGKVCAIECRGSPGRFLAFFRGGVIDGSILEKLLLKEVGQSPHEMVHHRTETGFKFQTPDFVPFNLSGLEQSK
ncbi:MAG: hypothetical protein QOH96_1168 [Blastocatellia bacterium]|nr:hypothetical protein [Blastocatellia bacterium]